MLKKYAEDYNLKVFVETGTYYGDTVASLYKYFEETYSIELNRELFEMAQKRFKKKKHIHIIYGDSGKELGNLMTRINTPTLFWLDGHYSGGVTAKSKKKHLYLKN